MRPIRTTSVLLALFIPLVSSAARPANAEEPAKPSLALSERCQKLSNEGDYQSALEACQQAHALNPEPGLLVYIAQIQTALLHPVQAREALLRYLSGPVDERNRKMAEGQIRYLETRISTLLVTTQLAGAEIRIDDQVMDASLLARGVPVAAGAHRVTLQANGSTFSRFIFLRGGERTAIELPGSGTIALSCAASQIRFFIDDQELDAAQATRGSPRAAGVHRVTFRSGASAWPNQQVMVNPDERVAVVCAPPPSAVLANPSRPASNPRGYWVAGVGLALGGAALATAIYNGNEYDRWQAANDSLRDDILNRGDLTLAEQARRAQENNQLMDSIQTRRKVAIGLGIAGGLVTAGGVALLFADSAAAARNRSGSWLRRVAAGVTVNGALSSGEIAWRGTW